MGHLATNEKFDMATATSYSDGVDGNSVCFNGTNGIMGFTVTFFFEDR